MELIQILIILLINLFFYNNNNIPYFPNLKSIKINQCVLSQSLIRTLSLLIQYQLDQLKLSIDENTIKFIRDPEDPRRIIRHTSN
ncbi:unnamed protein product [Rotaria sp. Silwood2]|nr:unnamed protein product [Rotaria sp. Silwood2]CAF3150351.1 unnamed protein product [Rotaria sp. Silwood2]CAF3188126.1 unnamed protein product [Rotaria sp. Silwood2]